MISNRIFRSSFDSAQDRRRGFIPLLALLIVTIILALGGGVYIAAQKHKTVPAPQTVPPADETATWKTYRNEKYGFEVKYPKNLYVVESSSSLALYRGKPDGEEMPGLFITVDSNSQGLPIENYYDGQHGPDYFNELDDFTTSTIAGVTAYVFIPSITFAGEVSVIIPRGNMFINISDIGSSFQASGVFDQILSTFKFIEPTDTSSWKTYRNEKYGFEFRYPPTHHASEMFDQAGANFYVKITGPNTQKFIDNTGGERTDEIRIYPALPASALESIVGGEDLGPIKNTESYFISEIFKKYLNTYIGKAMLGDRKAFQFVHSEFTDSKETVSQNSDGTWFEITSWAQNWPQSNIEPYDSILSTFKFIEPLSASEKNQMLDAARQYVAAHSIAGITFELEITKQVGNYAMLWATSTNMNIDRFGIIMEKVSGKWVARDMGTAFPDWAEKVPELFQ